MNEMKCKECYIDISDLEFSEGEKVIIWKNVSTREYIIAPYCRKCIKDYEQSLLELD